MSQPLPRVRREKPALSDDDVVSLYLNCVPADAFRGSCIFHSKKGCTLDRSTRTDVCNTYYCRGLSDYLKRRTPAGADRRDCRRCSEKTWASPVLTP